MKVEGKRDQYLSADGKFFKVVSNNGMVSDKVYRQIELYLPAGTGTMREPVVDTMNRWLDELESGIRAWRWAIGSTGGMLTARYEVRPDDGELVSQLAISGGMAK